MIVKKFDTYRWILWYEKYAYDLDKKNTTPTGKVVAYDFGLLSKFLLS